MKYRDVLVGLLAILLVGALLGCSSNSRPISKPSVAIVIAARGGIAPSPADVSSIYKKLQPEIERYGYVVAADPRSADYVVYVRDPVDPLGGTGGRITFVRVPSNDAIYGGATVAAREFKTKSERTNREMVTEPRE